MTNDAQAVTKIEALERLVDSGVRLLFAQEDPLTIQLVVASAYRALRDLADKRGDIEIRKTEIEFLEPGYEKAYYVALAEVSNFLKHADKDPDGILAPFDERRNDLDLTSCIMYLQALDSTLSTERLAYLQWCAIIYPHFFKPGAPFTRIASNEEFADLAKKHRGEQLATGHQILETLRKAIRA